MLRFKRVDEDVSMFDAAIGHTITRDRVWFRLGGWQHAFSCSCGWQGQKTGCGAGKTNRPAEIHARTVWEEAAR